MQSRLSARSRDGLARDLPAAAHRAGILLDGATLPTSAHGASRRDRRSAARGRVERPLLDGATTGLRACAQVRRRPTVLTVELARAAAPDLVVTPLHDRRRLTDTIRWRARRPRRIAQPVADGVVAPPRASSAATSPGRCSSSACASCDVAAIASRGARGGGCGDVSAELHGRLRRGRRCSRPPRDSCRRASPGSDHEPVGVELEVGDEAVELKRTSPAPGARSAAGAADRQVGRATPRRSRDSTSAAGCSCTPVADGSASGW